MHRPGATPTIGNGSDNRLEAAPWAAFLRFCTSLPWAMPVEIVARNLAAEAFFGCRETE
jgi:hypothetical protein